ncbi:MAG: hypothetical protein FWE88_01580 [Phycisphaerae bacterium]|nr:hypothetical protein [Phycisphaerae bacterium]
MANEWYRKTTWSDADRDDFEAHLKRSRGAANKSLYLLIQAEHLQDASPPLYREALALLERALTEWRYDSQRAVAFLRKAQCLLETEGFDAAIPFYRQSLEFEKQYTTTRTIAWREFPWQIVKHRRTDLYEEALKWLDIERVAYPIDRYCMSTVCAIVWMHQGDPVNAKAVAATALKAAEIAFSGLRYHPNHGLVGDIEPWAKAELERILSA